MSFETFLSYLHKDPSNIGLRKQAAEKALHEGKFNEGLELLSNQTDPSLVFLKSHFLLAQGDYNNAADLCQKLINAGLDQPAIRYNLAFSCLQSGKSQDGLNALKPALASVDTVPGLALLQARLLQHQYHLDEAREWAEHALQSAPNDPEVQGVYAQILYDLGDLENASRYASTCMEMSPNNREALVTAAHCALTHGDLDEASGLFQRASKTFPDSLRTQWGEAMLAIAEGNFSSAEMLLQSVVEKRPEHRSAKNLYAWCLFINGKADQAESTWQALEKEYPDFADPVAGQAQLALARGDVARAKTLVEHAIHLNPCSTAAQFAQVSLLAQSGDQNKVEALSQEILEKPVDSEGVSLENALKRFIKHQTIH